MTNLSYKHYYFKFQTDNRGFKKWYDSDYKISSQNPIQLSIYYGKWKANEKNKGLTIEDNKSIKSSSQINTFYSIKDKYDKVFFWIFYKEEIFCFKPIDGMVYDGPPDLFDGSGSDPKSMKSLLVKIYKKHELPEIFANINANQKYNRGTIAEIKGTEEKIANLLINLDKIPISKENWFEFLSPIEFETLIFLIFNYGNSLCSSFRGGTLKDVDLKVSLKRFEEFKDGRYWIQVKKKEAKKEEMNNCRNKDDRILVHLGKSNIPTRILGKDWLTKMIEQRKDIQRWLENMTFKYDLFKFKWR